MAIGMVSLKVEVNIGRKTILDKQKTEGRRILNVDQIMLFALCDVRLLEALDVAI